LWSVPVVAQIVWYFERISSLFLHPTGWAGSVALGGHAHAGGTENFRGALNTVTNALRRASYALSATSAQTVMKVIVPVDATAIFLGMARAVGETAPLVFTAGSFNFWPKDGMGEKILLLTYYI
jgi:phosphate transport system permease protein